MAVTRDGIPVRCATFPGNTGDQKIIRTVKDDLGAWNLHRLVWVADRGFASADNRAYLTRGGGHYIHAEKLRHTNAEAAAALARPGRYRDVAEDLRVKEVRVSPVPRAPCSNTTQIGSPHVCAAQHPSPATRVPTICGSQDWGYWASLWLRTVEVFGVVGGEDAWCARCRG